VQGAVLADPGDDQLGAVPGHARVVPGEPGGAAAVGREARPGDEPVPLVGEFAHGTPVLRGRPVERHGGQDATYVGGSVAGELLQHGPHFTASRQQLRLRPAQSAADEGDGGQRARSAAGFAAVQPLVGEVHEHHDVPAVHHRAGPGVAAVLDDAAADVPWRGQDGLLPAADAPPHEGAPAALAGSRLGPPRLVADEADVLGVPVVRGGEGRVDG
jgi:hypothetical protein